MPTQCQHIKAGGQQCRAWAMSGSAPPRCAAHRQDGGPPAPLFQEGNRVGYLNMTHGLYSGCLPPARTIEAEAVRLLDRHERLAVLLDIEPEPAQLLHLSRLYLRNLGRLIRVLDRYHATTGRHPDSLLKLANGQPKADYRAELERLAGDILAEAGSTYPTTETRSFRYWQIYAYIATYIERYWVGPTYREIKTACRISATGVLQYWLDKLEQDGRIIRQPGQWRGIYLPFDEPDEEIGR